MSWIRFNNTQATKTQDGLRGALMGYPSAPSRVGKLFFTVFDSPQKEAKKGIELVKSSSLLFLFIVPDTVPNNGKPGTNDDSSHQKPTK